VSWLKSMYQCEKESVPRRPDELTDINDASREKSVCTYTRSTRKGASQLLRESTGEFFGTQTPAKSVVLGAFKLALQQKYPDNSDFSEYDNVSRSSQISRAQTASLLRESTDRPIRTTGRTKPDYATKNMVRKKSEDLTSALTQNDRLLSRSNFSFFLTKNNMKGNSKDPQRSLPTSMTARPQTVIFFLAGLTF
jgi:hypothetical protein